MNIPEEPKEVLEDPVALPDVELCVDLLARLLTRGEKNHLLRGVQRLQFKKNMKSLSDFPEHHLAMILRALGSKQAYSFEAGLHMGVVIALCSRGGEGKRHLKLMIEDITLEQDGPVEEPKS